MTTLPYHIPHLACSVYHMTLKDLPAMVRLWWNSSEKRVFNIVDRFTSKYVSSVLSLQEISSVQTSTQLFNGMTVSMLLRFSWKSGFKCGVWCQQQVCSWGRTRRNRPLYSLVLVWRVPVLTRRWCSATSAVPWRSSVHRNLSRGVQMDTRPQCQPWVGLPSTREEKH